MMVALLGGCATPTNYVVVPEDEQELSAPPRQPVPGATPDRYTVKPGDSLYLISFATGTDWKDLARLNGIGPPYRIYPGQILIVRPGSSTPPASRARIATGPSPTPSREPSPVRASSLPLPAPAPTTAPTVPAVAAAPSKEPKTPNSSAPARTQTVTPVVASAPPPPAATAASPKAPQPSAVAPSSVRPPKPGAWQWPASGKVIGRFAGGPQPHKGIDLDGRTGDPVRAANSGVVVYAGSGVRGYGNLLIVKHDDVYLSAYAHNSELLVSEGDVVKAGQTIARIGDSGTDRVKLHFEVRRKGTPVDPAKVLPRR